MDQPGAAGVQPAFRDIDYLGGARREKMDIYLPAGGGPHPAVLIIHGGGWQSLDKASDRERSMAADLTAAGYACASINYRLGPARGTFVEAIKDAFPRNVLDCKTAVRFLRVHADRYGLDPQRVAAAGGSAGAHLAAMLAFTGPRDGFEPRDDGMGETPSSVRAAVLLYGVYDVGILWGRGADSVPPADRELARRASPLTYLGPGAPPCFLAHGTADPVIPVRESAVLAAALARAGVAHEQVTVEGAAHSFDFHPVQRDLLPRVLAFLAERLA